MAGESAYLLYREVVEPVLKGSRTEVRLGGPGVGESLQLSGLRQVIVLIILHRFRHRPVTTALIMVTILDMTIGCGQNMVDYQNALEKRCLPARRNLR
jgi:hypothetical protein